MAKKAITDLDAATIASADTIVFVDDTDATTKKSLLSAAAPVFITAAGMFVPETDTASGDASISITGLNADGIYRCQYNFVVSTSDQLLIRFNGDSTATNYSFVSTKTGFNAGTISSAVVITGDQSHSDINYDIYTGGSHTVFGVITFQKDPSTANMVVGTVRQGNYKDTDYFAQQVGMFVYRGSASLTSLQFHAESGTITGTSILERIA